MLNDCKGSPGGSDSSLIVSVFEEFLLSESNVDVAGGAVNSDDALP